MSFVENILSFRSHNSNNKLIPKLNYFCDGKMPITMPYVSGNILAWILSKKNAINFTLSKLLRELVQFVKDIFKHNFDNLNILLLDSSSLIINTFHVYKLETRCDQ